MDAMVLSRIFYRLALVGVKLWMREVVTIVDA